MEDKFKVQDPEIAKLVENLKNLQQHLEQRSRFIKEKEELARRVFEKCLIDAFGTSSPKLY